MRCGTTLLLVIVFFGCIAPAAVAEVNFGVSLAGAIPVGTFADKEGIIQDARFGYSAVGGAAKAGLGFNLELETRVSKVMMLGFRFGYVKYGADAADVRRYINNYIEANPELEGEVTSLDATWTHTFMSFPIRAIAREASWGRTYLRFDIGWVKIKNSFDGGMVLGEYGEQSFSSDFNLGSQFFLAGGVGADIKVGDRYAIIAEFRYNHIFSDGAEATATIVTGTITARQDFNTQTVEFVVGLRIPLSGI